MLDHFKIEKNNAKIYTPVRILNKFRKEHHDKFSDLSFLDYHKLLCFLGASKKFVGKNGRLTESVDINGVTTRVWFYIQPKNI